MDVNGINTTQAGNTAPVPQAGSNAELGKDEFLKLLITQLRHQDPLNPMEGTEFASQLAEFNSVEQLINLNEQVTGLTEAQDQMSNGLHNSLAATLTGKQVKAMSEEIGVSSEPAVVQYRLQQLASEVNIEVRDVNGNLVRSDVLENIGQGDHQWAWDGKSNAGQQVPEGSYSISLSASNGDQQVGSLTFTEGIVDRVRFTGEGVKLLVNGMLLPLSDVEEIGSGT